MEMIETGTVRGVESASDPEVSSDAAAELSGQAAAALGAAGHDGGAAQRLSTQLRDRAHIARASAQRALHGIWCLILLGLVLFVATPYYVHLQGADALKRTAQGLSETLATYGPHSAPAKDSSAGSASMSGAESDPVGPLLDQLTQLEQQAREMVRTQGLVAFDAAVEKGRSTDYDAIAARLIGSLFVVFLVRIMLQVYRAERRYAAFYDARADALVLGALESAGYRDAAELMGTDKLLEDAPVAAPYEWLASVANRFQAPQNKSSGKTN